MKRFTARIAIAVLTFIVGISVAGAWVIHSRNATISPVTLEPLGESPGNENVDKRTLEMVFVLDTTGSMGGLLEGAKQRIWGIVNEVMQSSSRPAVRIGLVAYRDRGDLYVTKILPLTNDLDQVYSTLMAYQPGGGGDTPENVRRALADGVHKAGWSRRSEQVAQIIFLVGDAPPHNYATEPDTKVTAAEAVQMGMIVNTIQCGEIPGTKVEWEQIAARGQGQYFSIAQDGGVQAIATPYDEQLGELGTRLGGTFLAYGGGAGVSGEVHRKEVDTRAKAMEFSFGSHAPSVAKAERAVNKALNAEAYVGDLLQNIENGSVKLDSVKDEDLPADIRKLAPAERKQEIDKRLAERRELRSQITALSKQREEFIAAERRKQSGGKKTGFDGAVAEALKAQLARKGIK